MDSRKYSQWSYYCESVTKYAINLSLINECHASWVVAFIVPIPTVLPCCLTPTSQCYRWLDTQYRGYRLPRYSFPLTPSPSPCSCLVWMCFDWLIDWLIAMIGAFNMTGTHDDHFRQIICRLIQYLERLCDCIEWVCNTAKSCLPP